MSPNEEDQQPICQWCQEQPATKVCVGELDGPVCDNCSDPECCTGALPAQTGTQG